jgi:hypothetical protein
VTVSTDAHDGIVSYAPTGFAGFASGVALTQTRSLMLCDHRSNSALGTD